MLGRLVTRRWASTAAELPKQLPKDKIPFAAPRQDQTRGDLGQVKMPDRIDTVPDPVAIPSEPDNYSATSANRDDAYPLFHAPSGTQESVYTVASPDTFPEAPTKAGGDDTILGRDGDASSALPKEADVSRAKDAGKWLSMLKDVTGVEIGHGSGQEQEYKFQDRALNHQERQGLYVLGGIVVAGYGLSRMFTEPARKEKHPTE